MDTDNPGDGRPERQMLQAFREAMASRDMRGAARIAVRLGDHYLGSDVFRDALGCYTQAAGDDLRSALDDREIGELYVRIARCHYGLGSYAEGREYCERVHELDLRNQKASTLAETQNVLAWIAIGSGRYETARSSAQKAREMLEGLPENELVAETSKLLGISNAELGNVDIARDHLTDYLVYQKRRGNEGAVASAHNNLGILAKRTGDLNRALKSYETALAIDRRLGRSAAVARNLQNMGVALFKLSRWDEAEQRLNEADEIYSSIGAARGLVSVEVSLGDIARARRDWARAEELLERALTKSRESGYLKVEAVTLQYRGHLEADRGEWEGALDDFDLALAAARRLSPENDVLTGAMRHRAEALIELGRLEEAEEECSRSLDLCRKIGDQVEEGATLRTLAQLQYSKGEAAAAADLIRQAEGKLRSAGESFELGRCALAEGVGLTLASAEEDFPLERIEAKLSSSASLFGDIGASHWVAACELARGRALLKAGELDRARASLERAHLKFEVSQDEQGVLAVDAVRHELDAQLAAVGLRARNRYAVIAEAYELMEAADPNWGDVHRLASKVAGAVSAARLVLATVAFGREVAVAMSVGRAGHGIADGVRFLRAVVGSEDHDLPLVVSGAAAGIPLPEGTGAAALMPAASDNGTGDTYLLYADRAPAVASAAFSEADVEFLGVAAPPLAAVHARVSERAEGRDTEDSAREALRGWRDSGLVTRSPKMLEILAAVDRLGKSRVPVLITGESGVGKELVARAIHAAGRKRTGDLIALNAGAVAPHLQESELFGHVKGAFTDAHDDRKGLLAAADHGSLFLDEVGEMAPELQVKLLRFLQDGEYRRIGENRVRKSDARVISATNKNLVEEMKAGRFRRDLLYRLCTFTIDVPPLRDRPEDVEPLMEHFLALHREREGKEITGFSHQVRTLFLGHDWRENNARELENEVRRAIALCSDGDEIRIDGISPELRERCRVGQSSADHATLREELDAYERRRILEALEECAWNRKRAAELLGISRTGLLTKMRKHGIG